MSTKIITYESIAEHLTELCPEWAIDLAQPGQLREAASQGLPFDSPEFRRRILRSMVVGTLGATCFTFVQALRRAGAIEFNDVEFE